MMRQFNEGYDVLIFFDFVDQDEWTNMHSSLSFEDTSKWFSQMWCFCYLSNFINN